MSKKQKSTINSNHIGNQSNAVFSQEYSTFLQNQINSKEEKPLEAQNHMKQIDLENRKLKMIIENLQHPSHQQPGSCLPESNDSSFSSGNVYTYMYIHIRICIYKYVYMYKCIHKCMNI
jgi:hypothetical protein